MTAPYKGHSPEIRIFVAIKKNRFVSFFNHTFSMLSGTVARKDFFGPTGSVQLNVKVVRSSLLVMRVFFI